MGLFHLSTMGRGPKKHLKRLAAPKKWMLDKLGGRFAPRPSTGPHKLRECLPLIVMLRNRLKYALTRKETQTITMQRLIQVDGKVRTDFNYPAGLMDTVSIEKTNEHFRILYDVKGRFALHRITPEEAKFKLGKVTRRFVGKGAAPTIVTHDGRTFRYADPNAQVGDSVKIDLESGSVTDVLKFDVGNLVLVTGGANTGRIGVLHHREKHQGSFDIVHVRDAAGHEFATRIGNLFVIGKGKRELVSLPKDRGVKKTILEERESRFGETQLQA